MRREHIVALGARRSYIMADLDDIGVVVLHYLRVWGFAPEYSGYGLGLSYVRVGGLTIKNSAMFDLELGGCANTLKQKASDIKVIAMEVAGLSLSSPKLLGLASISSVILEKGAGRVLEGLRGEDAAISGAYFGGRKQNLSAGGGIRRYDFPSMYANILRRELPAGFRARDKPQAIGRPGFYLADFAYSGTRLAPRLPVRTERGGVEYATSGSGLFWYEELLAFEACGGQIRRLHKAYETLGEGCYLMPAIDYLLRKRASGNSAAKGVANRIYGRLALNHAKRRTAYGKLEGHDLLVTRGYSRYKAYADSVVYEVECQAAAPLRCVSWASIVTARGRSKLMLLMHLCESEGLAIAGVNTDSVDVLADADLTVGEFAFAALPAKTRK